MVLHRQTMVGSWLGAVDSLGDRLRLVYQVYTFVSDVIKVLLVTGTFFILY
jgi:hypothetical protein